jgi:hypothetical protein
MADRVSASITIGGTLDAAGFDDLAEIIASEGLAIEWDGEPFEPHHHVAGEPLKLFAHEVAGGSFDDLEAWCLAQQLPFVRWCGGYSGQWGPERVVAVGDGTAISYTATEDDEVVTGRAQIEALGSFEAVLAHFDAAEFSVPPLVVCGATTALGELAPLEGAHVE